MWLDCGNKIECTVYLWTFEVENFRDFRDSKWNHENFLRKFSQGWIADGTTLRKFYQEMFNLERNHESFLPWEFGAIQYNGSYQRHPQTLSIFY